MRSKNFLLCVCAISLFGSVSAQEVSRDSISTLKQQKKAIVISQRLNDNKLKLAKLENSVDKETQNVQSTGAEAQKSADNNGQAADKLANDAENKKLANKASKSAKEAKHDAKEARKASVRLKDLKKDIESLKSKIAADESRLSSISNDNSNNMPGGIPPAVKN